MLRIKKEKLVLSLILTLVIFISIILFINFRFVNDIRQYVEEDSEIFKIVLRYVLYSIITFVLLVITSSYFITSYIYTEMKLKSEIDHLTKVYSLEKLNNDIDRLILIKEKFALCYIDFVEFKKVNDRRGHEYGDIVLKKFASYMLKLPCKYSSYRVGGDEFVIIIKGCDETDIMNALIPILGIYEIPDEDKPTTDFKFNVGVAFYPSQEITRNKLKERADSAMYKAKNAKLDYYISKN